MSKKNSNNIKKSTVSSGNKFSDDSVINEMDVLPSTKSIKMPIKFNVDFDPLIGYVNSEVTLAMSPDSTGLFTIGNNVDKYTGISKEETKEAVESGMETPDDAVIYGMCNVMNNGDDIFFWTNGTRLAGAADKVGVLSGINELLTHECLHLTRTILNKHILKNKGIVKWAESDWLSIGDQDDDIQEESFATALGLITEQVTPKFIEMASEYIPELKNSTLPKAQEGLDFQSRLNQFLKPSTFSPNILGRSSGRSNVGYEYKAGPFTQSTMFASDRRLAPVDKFTFASDNPNTQLSLNTGLNYKDKYGFKGAASYANTTAKNDPNAKFNVGYNRKGLTADYNYNYNKENPSYNLGAGYRGQGVTADFKMSKDKYNISFDSEGNVIKTPIKTPTYNTNVGYELDGVSGKFGFTGNKETPKYTFGVGYDKKGVTGEFTATKDQKKPFVYNANLGYNKDGFSTGLEFSGNKENPNYTYRVKYEPEKQGFTTDSNLEFTKGNIDATTGLGYKNKNINTGLSYKTSIDRENESQQNSLGANFGYRNKNFNTGVNYERRFATEENPASNKIGVNVGYRNKSGIGVNAGVDYKTLTEDQKKLEKASPFEFRAGVTYTPQRKRQQTPTKKFTFSKEDVKKEPINIKDLPAEFKKRFGGQHIYHDLFKQGGTVINEFDVIAQGGLYIQPTAQDSSDVYNKSKELQDYFKNKGYQSQGTTKLPYNDSNIFKRELDRLYGQFINQQSTNYPTSTGGSTSSKLDPKYYRKPTNPNKPTIIEQRESQFGTLDTRAPFGYYDTRIVPKEMSSYKNVNMKDPLRGDEVNIPIYDISVKPYAMRTPAEQAEVERKYGKPKPIVKPVFKDQQEADYPKSNSKAETVQSSNYSKYLNLTPQDVLDKYSFDEYSKAFGLDPVTMRNQISKDIKWDKISNLGEFDTEKFLTRKLYDYIQDNPPKAQKGLNKERKYGLSESDKQRILKEAERTKYQLTKPNGFMTNNPNWYKNSDLLEENIAEFFDPTGITSHDDAYRAYKEWKTSGNTLPNSNQALDMFGAVPALGKFGKLKYISNITDINNQSPYVKEFIKPIYKYFPWQQVLNFNDTVEDLDKDNIRPTKQHGGIIHESDIVKAQIGKYIPSWLNPYNYNVTDYSKYKTKDEAYAAARKAGEKEFMWNKNRYSTKMAGTPEEQLKWSGITDERTTSKSNIPGVNIAKERLEKNLVPYGYKDAFGRVYDAIINNKSRPFVDEDNIRYKLEDVSPERKDAYKLYMNKPQQNNTFGISKYRPSVTKEGDTDVYYKINNIGSTSGNPNLDDSDINYIYNISQENKGNNTVLSNDIMAHHKIGLGKDDRGEYMSYYDNWDLNPYELINPITGKEITTNVGKPFEIYDRFYFKDYGDGTKKRMYYTDDELKSFSPNKKDKNFDTIALQKELYNRGYKLPKSTEKNEEGILFFDGVYGDETKAALEDWQKKNPNKLISDGNKVNQASKYPYNWSSNTQSVPTSKTQYSNKQSGGVINESDVIKYKSGGNHGGLDRWFAEKWVDVKTGKECGRQEGEKRKSYPACRPSVRVTSKTPKTASELSSAEKEKFKRSKTSSQRINYQHKRNK